jgi:hypothetical protein
MLLEMFLNMIEQYKFGSITIDGKTYTEDVEVRWTGEVLKWWRKESHLVNVEDLKRAVGQNPDTIVIGSGESGIMKVDEEAKKFIQEKKTKLIIDKTEEATRTFNIINEESKEEEGRQNKVIGLFHLTC